MSSAINVGVLTLSSAKKISKYLNTFEITLFISNTANLCPMPESGKRLVELQIQNFSIITVSRSCRKWNVRKVIRFVGSVFRKESFGPKCLWICEQLRIMTHQINRNGYVCVFRYSVIPFGANVQINKNI